MVKSKYNRLTLLRKYNDLMESRQEDPNKSNSYHSKKMGFAKGYFGKIERHMKKRNMLEEFDEGPFRVFISRNGRYKPVVEKEEHFGFDDSLNLFEKRFNNTLDNIEKKDDTYDGSIRILWEISRELIIFTFLQKERFRFVLNNSSETFWQILRSTQARRPAITRAKLVFFDAIINGQEYDNNLDAFTSMDLKYNLIEYKNNGWGIKEGRVKELSSSKTKKKEDVLRQLYKRINNKDHNLQGREKVNEIVERSGIV